MDVLTSLTLPKSHNLTLFYLFFNIISSMAKLFVEYIKLLSNSSAFFAKHSINGITSMGSYCAVSSKIYKQLSWIIRSTGLRFRVVVFRRNSVGILNAHVLNNGCVIAAIEGVGIPSYYFYTYAPIFESAEYSRPISSAASEAPSL